METHSDSGRAQLANTATNCQLEEEVGKSATMDSRHVDAEK